MNYIKKYKGKEFKFYLNVKIPNNILGLFPLFYKLILGCWGKYCSQAPTMRSAIGSQYLCFNNCVNIDSKVVYFSEFSDKKINFLKNILDENRNMKTWKNIFQQRKINQQLWLQHIHAIPNLWKKDGT